MRRLRADDRGQIYTIEGLVAGLILVITLMYVTNSITFVSPQTEKTTAMKLTIKAEDIMTAIGSSSHEAGLNSELQQCIALWKGGEATDTHIVNPGEIDIGHHSIGDLNNTIRQLLPQNLSFDSYYFNGTGSNYKSYVLYNLYISYVNDTESAIQGRTVFTNKQLIYQGMPQENAITASKIVVLNSNDMLDLSSFWNQTHTTAPRLVEARLVIWTI